jgi:uncharacterized protein YqhQ
LVGPIGRGNIAPMADEAAEQATPPQGEYLQFGGMAVVEGVMMRAPNHYAVACRAPDGQIVVKTEPLEKTWIGRQQWLKKPFLRGTLAMLDTMALGIRAMNFAARVQTEEKFGAEQPAAKPKPARNDARDWLSAAAGLALVLVSVWLYATGSYLSVVQGLLGDGSGLGRRLAPWLLLLTPGILGLYGLTKAPPLRGIVSQKALDALLIAGTVVFSLAFGFLLFNATPQFLAEYIVRSATGSMDKHLFATNYVAEVVKVVFVIAYLAGISKIPSIHEVFKYHGAEHKAINAIERKQPLTVESAQAQTRLHPRCGTNFVIIVTLVSFLLFPLIPRDLLVPATSPGWLVALTRVPVELACLPIVAGVSYEVIRAAGKFRDQRWVEVILKPGLATQLITTAEPDDPHVEVAIASLEAVMKAEETGELTDTEATMASA